MTIWSPLHIPVRSWIYQQNSGKLVRGLPSIHLRLLWVQDVMVGSSLGTTLLADSFYYCHCYFWINIYISINSSVIETINKGSVNTLYCLTCQTLRFYGFRRSSWLRSIKSFILPTCELENCVFNKKWKLRAFHCYKSSLRGHIIQSTSMQLSIYTP